MDSRGSTVHVIASNRAGFRSDAVADATLLAANATKTIKIVTSSGDPATAMLVHVTNRSGQQVALTVTVSRSGEVRRQKLDPITQAPLPVTIERQTDTSTSPIRLADGESIDIYERVVSILEKNEGVGAQTGIGVRYSATLEPNFRGN